MRLLVPCPPGNVQECAHFGTVSLAHIFSVSGCVAAVSRAGAAAEIGGSGCRHDVEKLGLRVPLAVPATAVSVWCACDCVTDASWRRGAGVRWGVVERAVAGLRAMGAVAGGNGGEQARQ